jgi:hypothetical protein
MLASGAILGKTLTIVGDPVGYGQCKKERGEGGKMGIPKEVTLQSTLLAVFLPFFPVSPFSF